MREDEREGERQTVVMASTQISSELLWQCLKKGNAFSVRSVNNVWMSKEKGNLYSKHSYKYSGSFRRHTEREMRKYQLSL